MILQIYFQRQWALVLLLNLQMASFSNKMSYVLFLTPLPEIFEEVYVSSPFIKKSPFLIEFHLESGSSLSNAINLPASYPGMNGNIYECSHRRREHFNHSRALDSFRIFFKEFLNIPPICLTTFLYPLGQSTK